MEHQSGFEWASAVEDECWKDKFEFDSKSGLTASA